MTLTPATVLGARKAPAVEGQMSLFGPEDEPDTTSEEQTDSTTAPEESAR